MEDVENNRQQNSGALMFPWTPRAVEQRSALLNSALRTVEQCEGTL
jgi:hypothetical protein